MGSVYFAQYTSINIQLKGFSQRNEKGNGNAAYPKIRDMNTDLALANGTNVHWISIA
jgi:hypothetical protein